VVQLPASAMDVDARTDRQILELVLATANTQVDIDIERAPVGIFNLQHDAVDGQHLFSRDVIVPADNGFKHNTLRHRHSGLHGWCVCDGRRRHDDRCADDHRFDVHRLKHSHRRWYNITASKTEADMHRSVTEVVIVMAAVV